MVVGSQELRRRPSSLAKGRASFVNLAENSMRPIAIGRKNWLHLGSKEAGPKIAAIFSVVESCRRLNIPIRRYLADVLPGLANRSIHSLAELTPAAYAARLAN